MSAPPPDRRTTLREALKRTAAALSAAPVRFALAGSYALWVHGAAEPDHDADFVVAERDLEPAVAALEGAGFTIVRPPEGWLFKAVAEPGAQDATDTAVVIDVLHRMAGDVVEDSLLDRALDIEVLAVRMPVLAPTDVVGAQLRVMNEHYCDFGAVLPGVRSVREQLDWSRLRTETADNPFAAVFVQLCDRLGLTDRPN